MRIVRFIEFKRSVGKLPHSWKAFETAKRIAEALKESGYVTTSFEEMKVRGIIQIILEEDKNA